MNKQKLVVLCALLLCVSVIVGCPGDGGGQQQSGFFARGETFVEVAPGGVFQMTGLTSIRGDWLSDNGNAVGNTRSFNFTCIGDPCRVNDGRVPARWRIIAGIQQAQCVAYLEPFERDVTANSTQRSRCVIFGIVIPFNASPSSIDLQAPPPTVEMTGSGLSTAYGMPRIEYIDSYSGTLIGSATATAVNADGTWLQANTPDLSSVYSGTYSVLVSNIKADGSLEYVGTATVDCYGRDHEYEPPPDPCQPQTYNPDNPELEQPQPCY